MICVQLGPLGGDRPRAGMQPLPGLMMLASSSRDTYISCPFFKSGCVSLPAYFDHAGLGKSLGSSRAEECLCLNPLLDI